MTDKPDASVPDYAHVVVVPIANPRTAPELLRLARAFVKRDGGRVIALAVILSDSEAENERKRLDELEALVRDHAAHESDAHQHDDPNNLPKDAPYPADEPPLDDDDPVIKVEFVTRTAGNIARGILDQARESGAELIVLGVHHPVRGTVNIGSVTQSVMSAAPCDVLVFRMAEKMNFNRVMVPVDGTSASKMALRIAILFGNAFEGCPVEAIHVQESSKPEFEGRARIAQTLEGLPGCGTVRQTLVKGYSISNAILTRVTEEHLIIMGFSRRSDFVNWVEGESPSRRVLDRAPGPVLLAVRSTQAVTPQKRLQRRALAWMRPILTDIEQEQIVWGAANSARITPDYVVLMVVASALAALGLLANSAAVIIGAMLVAPLMSPLNAFAIALSTARLDIMRRASLSVLLGVTIASLVGIVLGLLVPMQAPTSEMLARVNPTLLDAFVALASGVVGSYATARKDIPAALAGVAIAAALVPPICTFGLQLAFGNPLLAAGAMLLFVTNIVFIVVIATLVFIWLGLHPLNVDRRSLRAYLPIVAFVLLSLPAVVALLNVSQNAGQESAIERDLRSVFEQSEVVSVEFISADPRIILAMLRTPNEVSPEAVRTAQTILSQNLEEPIQLRIITQRMVLAPEDNAALSATEIAPDAPLVITQDVIVPNEEFELPTNTPTPPPTPTP